MGPRAMGGPGPETCGRSGLARAVHHASVSAAVLAAIAAAFFFLAVREENRLLDAMMSRSLAGVDRSDTNAVVLALTQEIHARTNAGIRAEQLPLYERLESLSTFHMTSAVALRHGAFGVIGEPLFGPCGTMTRVLLNACWRLGIPARKLHLIPPPGSTVPIHTLVEWRAGGRWQVIAPSENYAWRTRDGRIATVEEIRGDSLLFADVYTRIPYFQARFGDPRHVRWEKLPGPLPGLIRAALGERRYRDLNTPRLYDEPRRLMLIATLLALGGSALSARLTRRAPRPRRA